MNLFLSIMLVLYFKLGILSVNFLIIKLFLFSFVALIPDLELGLKLALDHVSFKHILAVVACAADVAFEGSKAKKILMSNLINRQQAKKHIFAFICAKFRF